MALLSVVPAWVCRSFLWRQSCVFLSCSARVRLLSSLLLGFASVPLPAMPAVFGGVSCRGLPLGVYATFLAAVACPAPAVDLCLMGLRCLWCGAWFSDLVPCSSSGACGFVQLPCCRLPFGVSAFSDTVCLTYCCAGGIGWAATLPLCSQCFSCTGWLAGVR